MLAQYEEFKGLSDVESGSYGKTQSAKYKGKTVFIKQFTPQTKERLMAEFVVSCFLSYALKGIEGAPEFPQYGLIANSERKFVGFYSTDTLSDPSNIVDHASRPKFYSYIKATGCAMHAAIRFLIADPDSVPNHGWDTEEDLISFIDVGLAFYKELSLEDGEQGKLPERDVFEINQLNLMQWLFVSAKNAESFSPFHAFDADTTKLLPKSDVEKKTLRDFYQKYINALVLISNKAEKTLSALLEVLPAEIKSVTGNTITRLQQRSTATKLMLAEFEIEKLISDTLTRLTLSSEPAKAFFDKRVMAASALQAVATHSSSALKEKENLDPRENTFRPLVAAQRASNKGN